MIKAFKKIYKRKKRFKINTINNEVNLYRRTLLIEETYCFHNPYHRAMYGYRNIFGGNLLLPASTRITNPRPVAMEIMPVTPLPGPVTRFRDLIGNRE